MLESVAYACCSVRISSVPNWVERLVSVTVAAGLTMRLRREEPLSAPAPRTGTLTLAVMVHALQTCFFCSEREVRASRCGWRNGPLTRALCINAEDWLCWGRAVDERLFSRTDRSSPSAVTVSVRPGGELIRPARSIDMPLVLRGEARQSWTRRDEPCRLVTNWRRSRPRGSEARASGKGIAWGVYGVRYQCGVHIVDHIRL